MPKPINYPISLDAPDSEKPELSVKLKMAPPKTKFKAITKPDPRDDSIFTQEKLKRFGGTMRDIPQGMDGAMKKGGSVKRFFAGGSDEYGPGETPGDSGFTEEAPKSRGMEPAAKPKMNMGTAEDFKKSGLSRRDYLNKINNLKRRKDPTEGEAKDRKEQLKADTMGDIEIEYPTRSASPVAKKGNAYTVPPAPKAKNAAGPDAAGPDADTREAMRVGRVRRLLGQDAPLAGMNKGGKIKAYAQGGSVSSRADGCAQRGHTRGTMR